MILTANSTGNFNTAATWDSAITPGTIHASTNISILTTGKASTTFTAPNLVNYITGVWVYAATYAATGRNWTAEVLLAGAATGAIATIVQTDMPISTVPGWVYFRLPTPLIFTSLVAGTYSWNFKSTTSNSGAMAADNTSTTLVYHITTYDLAAAPTTADQVWIAPHNCTTAITVTVDGTTGDVRGGSGNGITTRSVGLGMWIGGGNAVDGAVLTWDTSASSTVQIGGEICIGEGGTIKAGTVASPYPIGVVATFNHWIPTAAFYRIFVAGGATAQAKSKFTMVGTGPTSGFYSTTLVSGVGTAASPLVVSDAVDWAVGDEICITPTSANATNYNETEYKFIKTKNSSTSYVLSATVGGAESAFTYTHSTNAKVLHMTRNVVFTPTNNLFGTLTVGGSVQGNHAFKWARFNNLGAASVSGGGLSNSGTTGFYKAVDYCVFADCSQGFTANSSLAQTYIGNIACRGRSSSNITQLVSVTTSSANQTLTDTYIVDSARNGFFNQGNGTVLNNPTVIANSKSGTNSFGIDLQSGGVITINNPNIHCNYSAGINLASSILTMNGGAIGTKGINQTIDIRIAANTANTALFDSCSFASATLLSGYLTGLSGATLIRFHRFNDTDNLHKWYTELGSASSTGSGLTDTLVRTPTSLNVRLAPEEATSGFSWSFLIPANKNSIVPFSGFFLKNVAMATDDCTVSMFLPGTPLTGTPDATVTLSDNVSNTWTGSAIQAVSLSAYYTGTTDGFATIVINAKTTTSAAYLYCADFYNSGDTATLLDKLAGLTIWYNGQPSPVITQLALGGIASAVWGVATSGLTVAGTTGNQVKKLLTVAKFLGLK